MATTTTPAQQEEPHWRDRAIAAAETISDAFDVAKAYGAHIANWVLFFCLMANLIEMVSPGVEAVAGLIIVGVQSISLDIAGFGLTAMAASAKRRGDKKSANKANVMGWTLISVMSITVGLITLAAFKPEWASNIQQANQVLMFVRVIVTVFYGHIVHQLREETGAHENRLDELEHSVVDLQRQLTDKQQEISAAESQGKARQKALSDLQVQLSNERESARVEIESLRGKLNIKASEVAMMETDQAGIISLKRELTAVKIQAEDIQTQLEVKQQALKNEQLQSSNLRREVERLQQSEAAMRQRSEAQRGTRNEALKHQSEAPKRSSDASTSQGQPAGLLRLPSNMDRATQKAEALRLVDSGLSTYKAAEQTNIPSGTIQRWLSERKAVTQDTATTKAREA